MTKNVYHMLMHTVNSNFHAFFVWGIASSTTTATNMVLQVVTGTANCIYYKTSPTAWPVRTPVLISNNSMG